jgi:hypothetical protein
MNTRHEQPLLQRHEGGVGPYRFGRRLRVGEGLGRVYEARNEETGNPAYVVTPTGASVDMAPEVALEYRVTTSVSPAYIACELVSAPPDAPPAAVVAELLDTSEDVMDVLRAAERTRYRLGHLLTGRAPVPPRGPPAPPAAEPGPVVAVQPPPAPTPLPAHTARGLRLVTALSLAAAGVLLALHVTPPPPAPEPAPLVEYTPAVVGDVVMTDMVAGASTPAPRTIERRLSMPDKPLEGQAVPPCTSPSREVNGGCWLLLGDAPPCPKNSVEHKSRCYAPVQGRKVEPASLREIQRGMAPAGPAQRQP